MMCFTCVSMEQCMFAKAGVDDICIDDSEKR